MHVRGEGEVVEDFGRNMACGKWMKEWTWTDIARVGEGGRLINLEGRGTR